MNKQDRRQLQEAIDLINQANEIITIVKEQEEVKYDNLPEGIQESERGDKFQENIDSLDSAVYDIESVIESLENVINQ